MGEAANEPDALLTWFQHQRRGWWRGNWWGLVLLFVLWLLTPFGQMLLMSWHVPGLARVLNRGIAVASWSPLLYPVILLIGAWLVARLGSIYSLPEDLLLTSNARACNRAFIAVLRRDAYLILGVFTFLPLIVICQLWRGVDGEEVFIYIMSLGGALALLVEWSVYLRVVRRRARIVFHALVPSMVLMVVYAFSPPLVLLLAGLAGIEALSDEFAMIFILPALSLVAAAVAWVLYRRSYSARLDCDSWRER